MLLGLHSLLFPTKVKAAATSMTTNFALFVSDSFHSPTDSAGQTAQQLSQDSIKGSKNFTRHPGDQCL